MQSPNRGYDPRIDHLRLFAALMVMWWHLYPMFPGILTLGYAPSLPILDLFQEGHTGVSLFMTLSGYLFYSITWGKEINYFSFMRSRLLRIMPLTVFWSLFLLYVYRKTTAAELVLTLFTTVDPGVVPGVGWSVIVEMQFYLLFPFLVSFVRTNGLAYLLALVALLLMVRGAAFVGQGTVQAVAYATIFGRLDQFAFGMMAAHLVLSGNRKSSMLIAGLGLAGASLTVYCLKSLGGYYGSPTTMSLAFWIACPDLEGISYAALIAGYVASGRGRGAFEGRALASVGALSYSIYWSHYFLIEIILHVAGAWGRLPTNPVQLVAFFVAVILPIVVGFSALSYFVIERSFLGLRRQYTASRHDNVVTLAQVKQAV